MVSDEDKPTPYSMPAAETSLAAAFRTRGYVIEGEVGRGGMATVYLAHDVKHDRRVALKVLSLELTTPQLSKRFAAEIRVTANLSHPNILPLFDSGNADGQLFYAMPHLEGDSLRARLKREGQLPIDEAVALVCVLAGALEYAHKRGVIHRDIKPENILFQDGQPLLADFGIALALTNVDAERLTGTSSIGTPRYMSPEQALGELTVGPASDIYSLGAVAYEILAGEAPFTGQTRQAVLARVMLEPPRPIRTVRGTVPQTVESAILKALAKQPVDRFASAAGFANALHSGGTGAVPRWQERIRGRSAAGLAVAVAAIAIALTVGAVQVREPFAAMAYRLGIQKRAPAQRVLVADFVGPRNDEHIGVVVHELVTSALNQSRSVAPFARDQLTDARRAALIPDSARIGLENARHLALRTQVRTVVDGRVDQVGTKYSIVLRGVNSWDGKTVASVQGAASESDLVATVNSMSRDLGRQLVSSDTTPMPRISWAASTPSLEAYRLLLAAEEAFHGEGTGSPSDLARQALSLDPEFASAWNFLAYASAQQGVGFDSTMFAYREALRHASRLSFSEKLYVEGMVAYRTGRGDSAVRLFDASLHEDPSNAGVYHDRGMALRQLGRWDDAAESFQLSVERETARAPLSALNSLATTLALNGQVDSARAVARRIPPGGMRYDAERYVAIAAADWDVVRRRLDSFVSDPRNAANQRAGNLELIASTQVARGQIDSAWQTLKVAETILPVPWRAPHADLLIGIPSGIRAPGRAPSPGDTMPFHPAFRAMWHVYRGDSVVAARAIREFRGRIDSKRDAVGARRADIMERWNVSGASGPRSLIDSIGLSSWSGNGLMLTGVLVLDRWLVADAYERLGRLDSAAVYFELLVTPKRMHFRQGEQLGYTHSFALRRLALLYDRMGRRDLAKRHWQQFLNVFTDPDPEFRPLVDQARAAVAHRNR